MAYITAQNAAVPSGSSYSDPIRVEGFDRVAIACQTFAVYCATASVSLQIQGSDTATTSTFYNVVHNGVYSAGSGLLTWQVPSATGPYVVNCEAAPYYRYIRLNLGANTATASTNVKVILVRNT